jgi:hypothetical protein
LRGKGEGRDTASCARGDLAESVIYAIKLHELKAKFLMISASYFVRHHSSGGRAAAFLI